MTTAWVYSLAECPACAVARRLAAERVGQENVVEVRIDHPLVELGVRQLFGDRQLHAPVVVVEGQGIYTLTLDEPPRLARIVSLERDLAAVGPTGR